MNNFTESVYFKDLESRFITINQSCARKFGLNSPEEAVGKNDFDFFAIEHAQKAMEDEQLIMATLQPIINIEEREVFNDADRTVKWNSTSKFPLFDDTGELIGTYGITKDVTVRKLNETELKESLKVISKQNERLSNFAHIVSHNLRNHASGISMLIELLQKTENIAEKVELFELLTKAATRLNGTIADLNEIMDTENKFEVELKNLNFEEIYQGIKEVLETEIRAHKATFEEEIQPGLRLMYSASYLESIILNLLSNAIKYKGEDKPHIKVKVWKEDNRVKFSVQDNGRGMDLEKYGDKLFGMYNTFHDNSNAKGIGLYITKNQVEALGGSITVESRPGIGSIFLIDFGVLQKETTIIPAKLSE